jgi:hypothetical protein
MARTAKSRSSEITMAKNSDGKNNEIVKVDEITKQQNREVAKSREYLDH